MEHNSTGVHRVLVIDDDEVMRELLGTLLTLQGYEVQLAASGEEGLALIPAPGGLDLILTDLQMPGLEGEALTAALREAAPPATLLLGMSGRQPAAAVLQPLDAFLSKPFPASELERTIAAARAKRSGGTGDAHLAAPPPAAVPKAEEAPLSTAEPPLDEAIFLALAKSFQPEQMRELYDLTLDDVEKRHARMEAAAGVNDLDEVKREAHAVKGACGMVGARELQGLAAAVEGGTSLNTSALGEIPSACDRLRRMLNTKLQH